MINIIPAFDPEKMDLIEEAFQSYAKCSAKIGILNFVKDIVNKYLKLKTKDALMIELSSRLEGAFDLTILDSGDKQRLNDLVSNDPRVTSIDETLTID